MYLFIFMSLWEYANSITGGFMYADTRQGILGQQTYLLSPTGEFGEDSCLTFYLFLKFQRDDSYGSFGYMMTSSNENIFRVTGHLCGESTGPGEFPARRPVTRSFDVFFDLRLNNRLSKQSWGWWFETLSSPLWRHCNKILVCWNDINHLIIWSNM